MGEMLLSLPALCLKGLSVSQQLPEQGDLLLVAFLLVSCQPDHKAFSLLLLRRKNCNDHVIPFIYKSDLTNIALFQGSLYKSRSSEMSDFLHDVSLSVLHLALSSLELFKRKNYG